MSGFEVSVWFERDRKSLILTKDGEDVIALLDDAVDEAIEDGYLTPPHHPRPTDDMWLQPMVDFARSVGALT